MPGNALLPNRLHHTAFVTQDQEATRQFYEGVLGFPLVATWCEKETLVGKERTYCHTFFEIGDGGALAFFQFADPEDAKELAPKPTSPMHHVAFQVDEDTYVNIKQRLARGADLPSAREVNHGYCLSLYIVDPNGMRLEFTLDNPLADEHVSERRAQAHADLKRWLGGDHQTNNQMR